MKKPKTSSAGAREFLELGVDFLDVASMLKNSSKEGSAPHFYCALHAIELFLKAHLVQLGVQPDELSKRKLGHDLSALLDKARTVDSSQGKTYLRRLGINEREAEIIKGSTRDYIEKCYEYPESATFTHGVRWWIILAHKLKESAFIGLKAEQSATPAAP